MIRPVDTVIGKMHYLIVWTCPHCRTTHDEYVDIAAGRKIVECPCGPHQLKLRWG